MGVRGGVNLRILQVKISKHFDLSCAHYAQRPAVDIETLALVKIDKARLG